MSPSPDLPDLPDLPGLPARPSPWRWCALWVLGLSAALAIGVLSLRATWSGRVQRAVEELEADGLAVSGLNPPAAGPKGADKIRAAHKSLQDGLSSDLLALCGNSPDLLAKALADAGSTEASARASGRRGLRS